MAATKRCVSSVSLFGTFYCCLVVVAAVPYQELEPRPGYVPVYIRMGNTPLAEINPKLAEAFSEFDVGNLMIEDDGKAPEIIVMSVDNEGSMVVMSDQLTAKSQTGNLDVADAVEQQDDEPKISAVVEEHNIDKESDIASFDVVSNDGGS